MTVAADVARSDVVARVVGAFRWVDGHSDLSGILRDPFLMEHLGPALAEPFADCDISVVAAVEAKGFVLGALVATHLRRGLVLIRKETAFMPGARREVRTAPDWRGRELLLRIRTGLIRPGDHVLLVDDWIETGAQAKAVSRLVGEEGADLVGVAVVIEDIRIDPSVRRRLNVVGLVNSAELATQ